MRKPALVIAVGSLAAMPASAQMEGMGNSGMARPPEFGREFVDMRNSADFYLQEDNQHRAVALALADRARKGVALPSNAAERIRIALEVDLKAWRNYFQVSNAEWKATQTLWLAELNSLTAAQWAERRASWFTARDAWLASDRKNPPILHQVREP